MLTVSPGPITDNWTQNRPTTPAVPLAVRSAADLARALADVAPERLADVGALLAAALDELEPAGSRLRWSPLDPSVAMLRRLGTIAVRSPTATSASAAQLLDGLARLAPGTGEGGCLH